MINSSGDQVIPPEAGRYLAEHIPHAKHVELPGSDHFPFTGEVDYVAEIEEFLTGSRSRSEPDRVLATVLFTDIVSSTEHAAELGDRSWTALLSDHHTIVRECLARFRGREIRITGDGVPRDLRRPRPRGPLCLRRARRSATPGDRDPGRPPHR